MEREKTTEEIVFHQNASAYRDDLEKIIAKFPERYREWYRGKIEYIYALLSELSEIKFWQNVVLFFAFIVTAGLIVSLQKFRWEFLYFVKIYFALICELGFVTTILLLRRYHHKRAFEVGIVLDLDWELAHTFSKLLLIDPGLRNDMAVLIPKKHYPAFLRAK